MSVGVDRPLPFVHPTVVHLLEATAGRVPEREPLVLAGAAGTDPVRLTYRQYLACVVRLARAGAWRIHGYGGPDQMRLEDAPDPQPAAVTSFGCAR